MLSIHWPLYFRYCYRNFCPFLFTLIRMPSVNQKTHTHSHRSEKPSFETTWKSQIKIIIRRRRIRKASGINRMFKAKFNPNTQYNESLYMFSFNSLLVCARFFFRFIDLFVYKFIYVYCKKVHLFSPYMHAAMQLHKSFSLSLLLWPKLLLFAISICVQAHSVHQHYAVHSCCSVCSALKKKPFCTLALVSAFGV